MRNPSVLLLVLLIGGSLPHIFAQNLLMHLNADRYVGLTNGVVSKWKFVNDTSKFCEQASLLYCPSPVNHDGGVNGHNSVRFASGTSGVKMLSFPNVSLNNGTVVLVASQDAIDNQMRYFVSGLSNNAYQGGLWLGGTQSNITGFGWESSPPSNVRQSNVEPIGWQVYTFTSGKLFLNGVETGYSFNQTTATALLNTLGGVNIPSLLGTHFLKGKIAEMFVYDYTLSPATITAKSDSLVNEYFPSLSLGPDTLACGSSYTLQPRSGAYYNSYQWSTGANTRELTITTDGTYWVRVNSFGKTVSDTITVTGLAPRPVITPTSDQMICLGRDTLTFARIGNAANTGYVWSTGQSDSVIRVTSGGPVFLIAQNQSNGCVTRSDTVLLTHKIRADFANPAACPGKPASFHDLSVDLTGDTVTTWSWNFGDPTTTTDVSTDTNGVWTYARSGTYPVYLRVTASDGCADSISKNIIIKPSAVPLFNWQGLCYGKPTQFFDRSTPESGTQVTGYQWTFRPGVTSSFVNPATVFDTAGIYPVSLTIYTASGCNETVLLPVPVNKGVNAAFDVSDSLCARHAVDIADQSQGVNDNIVSWLWRFGSNTPVSGQAPVFSFQGTGSRIVRLTVTTAAGCTDSVQKTVFVRPAPTAAFSFVQNGGTPPFTPQVINQSTDADHVRWNFGSGFTETAYTPVLPAFPDTGTYTVRLAVRNDEGCTDTVSKKFVVFTGDRTLQLMNATCTAEDGFVTYSARVLNKGGLEVNRITFGANLDYNSVLKENWEGSLLPGQVIDYTFKSAAKYFTDANFCCVRIDRFNDSLSVNPPDNEICLPLSSTAWFSTAYPTPTDGQVTIDYTLPFADKLSAALHSVDGKTIRTLFTNQAVSAGFGSLTADVADLRAGVYVIRFYYREKNYPVKLIKR